MIKLNIDFFKNIEYNTIKDRNILRVETRKSCAGYGTG